MASSTTKGVPFPVPADVADVPAAFHNTGGTALADWLNQHAYGGEYTTTQRNLLVAPNLWPGMLIWNSTTAQLEVNASGTAGSGNWSPAFQAAASDAPAGTPSLRSLGTGANQAAQGSWFASAAAFVSMLGAAALKAALAITQADVAGLATALGLLAPLDSAALTGIPTAPTAAVDTSTTQLATTAFVTGQASSSAPAADGAAAAGTSKRYARADHVHPTDTSRAPVNNPTLAGTITLGTADTDVKPTRAVTLEYNGRTTTLTYDVGTGLLTGVVEKSGSTTVYTAVITYTAGQLTQVVETAGGKTLTSALTYTSGQLTSIARSMS